MLICLLLASNLAGMFDAWLTGIAEQHWKSRAETIAAIRTPADVARRQAYVRQAMLEGIGGLPATKTPLNARITGTLQRDGYRIDKLVFESLPGFRVTANLYIPAGISGKLPAVLGVAGHSDVGKAAALYQQGWVAMARRGWIVLAYDPPGQGERSEYWDASTGRSLTGIGTREHTMAGLQCLLTGTAIARYEIWDGIRAVDYLLTRPDVDPTRIAVAGNSGGGTQSAYLAALEPRLATAAPSCYITSWPKLWTTIGPQDAEQNFHAFIAKGLDFPDFLLPMAPRPVSMMTAIRDFFSIDGARATFAEATRLFDLAGAAGKVEFFEYDDGHGWSKPRREATYRFFTRVFHGRQDEGIEPEISPEPPELLEVTTTGQLATSLGSETVSSLNRKLAEELYPKRKAATGAAVDGLIRSRLAFRPPPAGAAIRTGETGRDGYRLEHFHLAGETGITVPAVLALPAAPARPLPAALVINSAGKSADSAPGGDLESLARAGYAALSIDARGWGETAPASRSGGYSPTYQTFMRAYLLGLTVPGAQLADLHTAVAFLRSRTDIDASRLIVLGKGNGGPLALYLAALDSSVAKVAVEGAFPSFLEVARAARHDGIVDALVPGVLLDFDLPDVARAIAPRPVWIANPRNPAGGRANTSEYSGISNVKSIPRPDGWSFAKAYADFLAR